MKLITTSLLATLPTIHGKAIGVMNRHGARDINVGGIGLDTVLGATGAVDLGFPVSVNIALPPVASQGTAILTGGASGDFDVVLHAFSSIQVALQNLAKVTNEILLQLNVNVRTTKRQSPSADLNAAFTAAINAIDGGTSSLNGIDGTLSLTQAAALVADQVAVRTAVTAFVGILITNQGIFVQACLGADVKAQAGSLLTATANLQAALNAKGGLVDLSALGLTYQPALDLIQSLVGAYAGQDVLPVACVVSSSSTMITISSTTPISSSTVSSTSMFVSSGSSAVVSSTSSGIVSSSSTSGQSSYRTDTPSSSNTISTQSSIGISSSCLSSSTALTTHSTTPDTPSSSMPVSSTDGQVSSVMPSTSNTLSGATAASSVSSPVMAPSSMPSPGPTDGGVPSDSQNGGGSTAGSNTNANAGGAAGYGPSSGACTCAQGGGSGSGSSDAQAGTRQIPSRSAAAAVPSSTSVKYTGAASIASMDATLGIVAGLVVLLAL